MRRAFSGVSRVGAAICALVAVVPLALAESDNPPLPPLIEEGLLGSSCAEARNAAEPICQRWRRDYEAWEERQRAKPFEAAAAASGPAGAALVPPESRACLQADAAQSSECQKWLKELVAWYQRRLKLKEIAQLEAEVQRLGNQPARYGFLFSFACLGGLGSTDSGSADFALSSCSEYLAARARLEAVRAALTKLEENGRGPEPEEAVPPPAPSAGLAGSCDQPSLSVDPRCRAWLDEVAAWRERREQKTRERQEEVARLAAEVERIGDRVRDGQSVAEICRGRATGKPANDPRYREHCAEYYEAVARMEQAREALRAYDSVATLIDPAPPGGSHELAGRICLDPEIFGTEDCQNWSKELKAWETRQTLRKELPRLQAEVTQLGEQRGRWGFSLTYLCGTTNIAARECRQLAAATDRLKEARARLAEAEELHAQAREEVAPEAASYLVLVNANNRYLANAQDMRERVRKLYLKAERAWPDEVVSKPFGRPAGTPAQDAFVALILGMTPKEVAVHWRRLRGEERLIPPPAIDGVRALLQQIARDEGAFGVVAADESERLPAKVRVLFRFASAEGLGTP